MAIKTYDRNLSSGLALIANDERTIVQYIHIRRASPAIADISFAELKQLHAVAAGLVNRQIGGPKAEFSALQWIRYAEGMQDKVPQMQFNERQFN